jgi:Uma2 family endonuclease
MMMLAEQVEKRTMTAEQLAQLSPEASRGELIEGEFFAMSPAGQMHGEIAATILIMLGQFARRQKSGRVYAAETGFILKRNPDTVRAPDVAFVRSERLSQPTPKTGFFDGPPDLAVEVVSPSETQAEIDGKLLDYLDAGVQVVWIVYPTTRTIAVYRSLTAVHILTINDTLDCPELLPDFTASVKEVFA